MPLRPNYRRVRLERERAAHDRADEKQEKGLKRAPNAKPDAPKTNRLSWTE
jgi:hypothetical protein